MKTSEEAAKEFYSVTETVGYGYIQSNHKTVQKKRVAFVNGWNECKKEFAASLSVTIEHLLKNNPELNASDGWQQVNGKGEALNRAYGQLDMCLALYYIFFETDYQFP